MKKAFISKSEKSNKFWTINYSGCDFSVNYGKVGTFGKFQIKEFDTEEKCNKEAEKLISQKLKKGYEPYPKFDFNAQLYFDDIEIGVHEKTSHPIFVEHFKDELYYSCGDEEAPFGSDEGHDTLAELMECIRKSKTIDFTRFPKKIIEETWDMKYFPPEENMDSTTLKKLLAADKDNEMLIFQSDQVTMAVAFGQIKITGKISQELKKAALLSLKRIGMIAEITDYGESEILEEMISDLESFTCSDE